MEQVVSPENKGMIASIVESSINNIKKKATSINSSINIRSSKNGLPPIVMNSSLLSKSKELKQKRLKLKQKKATRRKSAILEVASERDPDDLLSPKRAPNQELDAMKEGAVVESDPAMQPLPPPDFSQLPSLKKPKYRFNVDEREVAKLFDNHEILDESPNIATTNDNTSNPDPFRERASGLAALNIEFNSSIS